MTKQAVISAAGVLAAVAWVAGLALGVWFGPQLEMWSWGPAMLALAVAGAAAVLVLVAGGGGGIPGWLAGLGIITVGWFGWRAWRSPVAELGLADGLLMLGAVLSFGVAKSLEGNGRAERVVVWGVALLVAASAVLVAVQMGDPGYSIQFGRLNASLPGGFFGGYSEGANFLIGGSLLLGGVAVFGRGGGWERLVVGGIALSGLAAVVCMRSRGGMVGGAAGLAAFMVLALVQAKRQNSRWFAAGVVLLPVLGIAVAAFLWLGWDYAQESRFGDTDIDSLLDNTSRLHMGAVAVDCMLDHPWAGGGSRSFSWECYQHWDSKAYGFVSARPDLAHNELLQACVDYGLIGGGLLVLLLGGLGIRTLVRMSVLDDAEAVAGTGAWRVGGVAAAAGMLVQSNFSFLLHVFPAMVLLGYCVGAACRGPGLAGRIKVSAGGRVGRLAMALPVVVAVIAFLPLGVRGTQIVPIAWPAVFGTDPSGEESLQRLESAVELWPQYDLALRLAHGRHQAAADAAGDALRWRSLLEEAREDYRVAGRLNRFEPIPLVNGADIDSMLGRDEAAEQGFELAVRLQGGMEAAFHGHAMQARHFLRKGRRLHEAGDEPGVLEALRLSSAAIEKASAVCPLGAAGRPEQIFIHESYGAALEAVGDWQGALAAYDLASRVAGGHAANFRAGRLLAEEAGKRWLKRKPEEALFLFLAAKDRIAKSNGAEVPGYTAEQRSEVYEGIMTHISSLEAGKILPKAVPLGQ